MKKIMIIACIAGSIAIANAQIDTTDARDSRDLRKAQSQNPQATKQAQTQYQDYPTKDMRRMNSSDVPAGLRTTLQGSEEYKGWENGTVYYNANTKEYFLRNTSPGSSSAATGQKNNAMWYHFDKEGKRVPDRPDER